MIEIKYINNDIYLFIKCTSSMLCVSLLFLERWTLLYRVESWVGMFVIIILFGTYVSFRFQDIAGDFETALDIPFNRASGIHVNLVMQYIYLSFGKEKKYRYISQRMKLGY